MATFGAAVRDWRQIRRMSQLDLALCVEVSARHVSFLETGRARPSRDMVLRLCSGLMLSQADTNALLQAAGFAAAFAARQLSDAEMAPLRRAVDWMLQRHAPYPAFALDRHWRLQAMNSTAELMLVPIGMELGDSLLDALLGNAEMRARIDNLAEVEWLTLQRLRSELAYFGQDPVLEAHVRELQARQSAQPRVATAQVPPVIPTRFRIDDQMLSLFSAVSQFGTVEDIALSDLQIECFFPADEPTRLMLEALAAAHSGDPRQASP